MASTLTTFQEAVIPISELVSFYSLDNIPNPLNRPYTWTMSVSTLDGFISFKDPHANGATEVALAHVKNSGSLSDWRLLNAGWMLADAVLGSGAILRSEPGTKWVPTFEDMIDYRVNVLKKSKYPLNVVLTGSGGVDLTHPIFHDPDLHTVILTSKVGYETISQSGHVLDGTNTKIEVIGDTPIFGVDELKAACQLLFEKYQVKLLDVTAGGVVIGSLIWLKLVDEMRITLASHVCGEISSTGEKRPHLFSSPPGTDPFTCHNNPILDYHKIGVFGIHHIFVRGLVRYRH